VEINNGAAVNNKNHFLIIINYFISLLDYIELIKFIHTKTSTENNKVFTLAFLGFKIDLFNITQGDSLIPINKKYN